MVHVKIWVVVCLVSLILSWLIHAPFWLQLSLMTFFLIDLCKLISFWIPTYEFILGSLLGAKDHGLSLHPIMKLGINTFICPNIIWQIQTWVSSLIYVQCKQVGMTIYVRSQNLDKSWICFVSMRLFLLDFYVASCNVTCRVFIFYGDAKKKCHNGLQKLKRSCVQSTNSTFIHELILIWSSYFNFDMIFCVKTCVNLLWFSSSWMFEVIE